MANIKRGLPGSQGPNPPATPITPAEPQPAEQAVVVERSKDSERFAQGDELKELVFEMKAGDVKVQDPFKEESKRAEFIQKNVKFDDWDGSLREAKVARKVGYGMLISGPPGTGKSVGEDEGIVYHDGGAVRATTFGRLFRRLASRYGIRTEMQGWQYIPLDQSEVEVLGMSGGNAVWARPQFMMRHRYDGPMVNVRTETGRMLKANPSHSFLDVDGHSIPAAELRVGMSLPILRAIPRSKASRETVEITPFVEQSVLIDGRLASGFESSSQTTILPFLTLDPSAGWFFGFYAAEGTVIGNTVSFSNKDLAALETTQRTGEALFGVKGHIYKDTRDNGLFNLSFHSKPLAQFFSHETEGSPREIVGKGGGARVKKVPDFILESRPEVQTSFIQGLFEGDGWHGREGSAYLTTASYELANGVVALCMMTGHFPSIERRRDPANTKGGSFYNVHLSVDSTKSLEVGEPVPGSKSRFGALPITVEMSMEARLAYAKLPKSVRAKPFWKATAGRLCRPPGRRITVSELERIAVSLRSEKLYAMSKPTISSDEIIEIRPTKCSNGLVYDFQVSGIENFAAGLGGIITHNTQMARRLSEDAQIPLYRLNFSEGADESLIIGSKEIQGNSTVFTLGYAPAAFQHGGILYLDEINAAKAEILVRLHPFLEKDAEKISLPEAGGITLKRNPNFFVVATVNPKERSSGTKDLGKALKSRLTFRKVTGYPPPTKELNIIEGNLPYKLTPEERDATLKVITNIANPVRNDKDWNAFIPSIRETQAFAQFIHESDMTPREIGDAVFTDAYDASDPESRKVVSAYVTSTFPPGPLVRGGTKAAAAATTQTGSQPSDDGKWKTVYAGPNFRKKTASTGSSSPPAAGSIKKDILDYKAQNPTASNEDVAKAVYGNRGVSVTKGRVASVAKILRAGFAKSGSKPA